jgi:hypothetical protein
MDTPDFASLYDWMRSAEQIANQKKRRNPNAVKSLSEVYSEPHRFVVVILPHPEDLVVEPPYIVDLAKDEAIAFRKTRGMGMARLNKLSDHGVKFLDARTKRSRRLLERLWQGRRLTGDMIS